MSKPVPEITVPISLSIFDRLTDTQPNEKTESRMSRWEEARELKASMSRDLTFLLNTRLAESDFDSGFEQATNSLLTFGMVDFTSYNLKDTAEQNRLRRSIERAIRQFEPRLTRVSVTIEEPDPLNPVLNFQISGMLHTALTGEAVLFNSFLQRDSRRFAVSCVD